MLEIVKVLQDNRSLQNLNLSWNYLTSARREQAYSIFTLHSKDDSYPSTMPKHQVRELIARKKELSLKQRPSLTLQQYEKFLDANEKDLTFYKQN
jgi:hypothetical protein